MTDVYSPQMSPELTTEAPTHVEGPVTRLANRRRTTPPIKPPAGPWICSTDATLGSGASVSLVCNAHVGHYQRMEVHIEKGKDKKMNEEDGRVELF